MRQYDGRIYNANRVYSVEEHEDEIKELLLYRKIIKVDGNKLFLDNGIELEVYPNVGCSGCGSGAYYIIELNNCDNVITNVELICDSGKGEWDKKSYKIFVYAEDSIIKVLQVDGLDGNGYYGTGYEIAVRLPYYIDYKDIPDELKMLVELGVYTEEDAAFKYSSGIIK